ncbi:MAG TPA: hypothetical protein VGC99_09660 [Candidatus Tectomicrobia bacterium]
MGSTLRTWMASWPWGVWVPRGLWLLALLFVLWIVLKYLLVPYIIFPCYTWLTFKGRTAKAKEKLADSLMSCSTAVFSAVCISLLIFPLTAFIQTMAREIDPVEALVSWWHPDHWSMRHAGVFLVLYWIPLGVGLWLRRRALVIYDAIASSAPAVAPTAKGTHEQLTFPDPGPPVYVRANEGSRRRRRHRTK